MCGIFGLIRFNPSYPLETGSHRLLHHRGPDENGTYADENVFLAHHRLSIIDLASGHQPMTDSKENLVIVYNGEIYNYKALRNELSQKGYTWKTSSDTEVLLNLYSEYGEKCLSRLNGMFAFTIWDKKEKKLFCARDRLGIKPFYYAKTNKHFLFSSEIKALYHSGLIPEDLNTDALLDFLVFYYIPKPETIYSSVHELEPAHYMILKEDKLEIKQYWDPRDTKEGVPKNLEAAMEQAEYLLKESVKDRLVSDVPYGVFLSGGIDSSLILSHMTEHIGKNVKAFCIGFEDPLYDESPYAKACADHYNAELNMFRFTPKQMIDTVIPAISHFDQPFADEASLPTYLLSMETKKHVKMVLSGEGGDELFFGYTRYRTLQKNILLNRVFPFRLRGAEKKLAAFRQSRQEKLRVYAKALSNIGKPASHMYYQWISTGISLEKALHPTLLEKLKDYSPEAMLEPFFSGSDSAGNARSFDFFRYLPYDLLKKVDMMTMASGLEARVPFLDHRLIEFAFSLPTNWHCTLFSQKKILKHIARKRLPTKLWKRKKHGFFVPIGKWFRKEMKEMVTDTLFQNKSEWTRFFNEKFIKNALDEHVKGKADYTRIIWMAFVFETWLQETKKKKTALSF